MPVFIGVAGARAGVPKTVQHVQPSFNTKLMPSCKTHSPLLGVMKRGNLQHEQLLVFHTNSLRPVPGSRHRSIIS